MCACASVLISNSNSSSIKLTVVKDKAKSASLLSSSTQAEGGTVSVFSLFVLFFQYKEFGLFSL